MPLKKIKIFVINNHVLEQGFLNKEKKLIIFIGDEKKVLPVRSPLENLPGLYDKGIFDEMILVEFKSDGLFENFNATVHLISN